MEWTEELIAHLRALWDAGQSTAEIGRVIGMSKNAVVGKAHRLHLLARPSPIRREAGEQKLRPRPLARARTLPPLAAIPAETRPEPVMPRVPAVRVPAVPRLPSGEAFAAAGKAAEKMPFAQPERPARGREMACCWPLGEPGKEGFHFCGAVAALGKPYCATHAQLAYVRLRDRRDDAA